MRAAAGFVMVGGGLLIMWSVLMGWHMPWEPAAPAGEQNIKGRQPTGPLPPEPFGSTPAPATGYGGPERLAGITAGFAMGL